MEKAKIVKIIHSLQGLEGMMVLKDTYESFESAVRWAEGERASHFAEAQAAEAAYRLLYQGATGPEGAAGTKLFEPEQAQTAAAVSLVVAATIVADFGQGPPPEWAYDQLFFAAQSAENAEELSPHSGVASIIAEALAVATELLILGGMLPQEE